MGTEQAEEAIAVEAAEAAEEVATYLLLQSLAGMIP